MTVAESPLVCSLSALTTRKICFSVRTSPASGVTTRINTPWLPVLSSPKLFEYSVNQSNNKVYHIRPYSFWAYWSISKWCSRHNYICDSGLLDRWYWYNNLYLDIGVTGCRTGMQVYPHIWYTCNIRITVDIDNNKYKYIFFRIKFWWFNLTLLVGT